MDRKEMSMVEMPKIELHCHLDGSMSIESIKRIMKEEGITPEDCRSRDENVSEEQHLKEMLTAPADCKSLAQYLEKFELPIRCLQTKASLEFAACDLARRAAEENVKYIEVRFAPSLHKRQGLKVLEIIECVQKGLARAKREYGIYSGIIVCGMRNLSMEENLSMLREAQELFCCGVVGCDLAGDEKAYPTRDFFEFFQLAKKYRMPYTIHSGECGDAANIKTAIDLGAKRLGHGIAMAQHPELMKICANKKIGVELCPTSNLQTKAVASMEEYPFEIFRNAGIMLSINTDNRTVSETTCTGEFLRLAEVFPLEEEHLRKIYQDSVEMSFAAEEIKHELSGCFERGVTEGNGSE